MFSLMRCKQSGICPQLCFFSQSMESSLFLAVDKMFSIALVTTKFLSDFRPRTGFSLTRGTGAFLWAQSQEKLRTRSSQVVPGGKVSLPMVPVCFFRNSLGVGLRSPFRCPKVLPSPYSVCACRPRSNSPPKFAPCVFSMLLVVWKWYDGRRWSPLGVCWQGIWTCRVVPLGEECTTWELCCRLIIPFLIMFYLQTQRDADVTFLLGKCRRKERWWN